jgi:uncharacterized protein
MTGGPGRVLAGVGALLLLVLLEAGIVAAFDSDFESLAARLGIQAMLAATLVGVAFAFAAPGSGLASAQALGLRRPPGPFLKATGIAYLAYFVCALVIAATLQPEQEDVTRDLGLGEGVVGSIAAGLLIVGAAPIAEEVFFRGFMFAGIRRGARFAIAAGASATVWGIFHYTGPGSWGVVLQLAVFGVALAWLYERTGSLWPPIAVHTFNNALAFAILAS